MFFRLFNAQTTASTFNSSTTYRTFSDGVPYGHKIPLLGIENGEYTTIPCFATPRVNLTRRRAGLLFRLLAGRQSTAPAIFAEQRAIGESF